MPPLVDILKKIRPTVRGSDFYLILVLHVLAKKKGHIGVV